MYSQIIKLLTSPSDPKAILPLASSHRFPPLSFVLLNLPLPFCHVPLVNIGGRIAIGAYVDLILERRVMSKCGQKSMGIQVWITREPKVIMELGEQRWGRRLHRDISIVKLVLRKGRCEIGVRHVGCGRWTEDGRGWLRNLGDEHVDVLL